MLLVEPSRAPLQSGLEPCRKHRAFLRPKSAPIEKGKSHCQRSSFVFLNGAMEETYAEVETWCQIRTACLPGV